MRRNFAEWNFGLGSGGHVFYLSLAGCFFFITDDDDIGNVLLYGGGELAFASVYEHEVGQGRALPLQPAVAAPPSR